MRAARLNRPEDAAPTSEPGAADRPCDCVGSVSAAARSPFRAVGGRAGPRCAFRSPTTKRLRQPYAAQRHRGLAHVHRAATSSRVRPPRPGRPAPTPPARPPSPAAPPAAVRTTSSSASLNDRFTRRPRGADVSRSRLRAPPPDPPSTWCGVCVVMGCPGIGWERRGLPSPHRSSSQSYSGNGNGSGTQPAVSTSRVWRCRARKPKGRSKAALILVLT